jgi:pimeloyl-ACP methyl ester carboxylesterase
MEISAFFPYRSQAARDACFAYFDALAARSWPVASEERLVPTSFGSTFVRIAGPPAAQPLVLLHGAGATSLMWAPNVGALSAECRVFAVDQIGEYGRSVCTKPIASMADFLAWLDELFDGLQLNGGLDLLGLSYGGALAAQYALHRPDRLRKLVLLAPANTVLRQTLAFWVRVIFFILDQRRGLPSFFRWIFADINRQDPAWVDDVIAQTRLNFQSVVPHRPPMPPVLSDAEWAGLKPPTLFLVGDNEKIYSARAAVRRLGRVSPQVTAGIVPGAGHDLSVVQSEIVNRRVLEFLRAPGALTAG